MHKVQAMHMHYVSEIINKSVKWNRFGCINTYVQLPFMKIFISALLLAFVTLSLNVGVPKPQPHKNHFQNKTQQTVYICKGPKSLRFHSSSNCSGLGSCSTELYSVSVSEAKNLGRTPCQICY